MGTKCIKWDFTNQCNLRCLHCSVGTSYFNGGIKGIPLTSKLQIVDNLANGGVNAITLLGGEPLTRVDDMCHVSKRATSLGIAMTLVTNGTLLNEMNISKIIASGISTVVVSLDGASPKTHDTIRGNGTYQTVIANINKLVRYNQINNCNINIKINTVLNKVNYQEIGDTIDLCIMLGVDELSILSLMKIGHTVDNVNKLMLTSQEDIDASIIIAKKYSSICLSHPLKITQQIAYPLVSDLIRQEYGLVLPKSNFCCSGSISLGFIDPDGNLYACDRILSENYIGKNIVRSTIKPMNLLKHDFYAIWNSDYFIEMFKLILSNDTYSNYTPCNRCKYLISRECNPCPLYSLDRKVEIQSCLIAERQIRKSMQTVSICKTKKANVATSKVDDDIDTYYAIEDAIPLKNSGIRSMDDGDDMILFSPYSNDYHILTLVGKYIWSLINGIHSVDYIANQLNEIIEALYEDSAIEIEKRDLDNIVKKKIGGYLQSLEQAMFIKWSATNTVDDLIGS